MLIKVSFHHLLFYHRELSNLQSNMHTLIEIEVGMDTSLSFKGGKNLKYDLKMDVSAPAAVLFK